MLDITSYWCPSTPEPRPHRFKPIRPGIAWTQFTHPAASRQHMLGSALLTVSSGSNLHLRTVPCINAGSIPGWVCAAVQPVAPSHPTGLVALGSTSPRMPSRSTTHGPTIRSRGEVARGNKGRCGGAELLPIAGVPQISPRCIAKLDQLIVVCFYA